MMTPEQQAVFVKGVTERWRAASLEWVNERTLYRYVNGPPDYLTESLNDIEMLLIALHDATKATSNGGTDVPQKGSE